MMNFIVFFFIFLLLQNFNTITVFILETRQNFFVSKIHLLELNTSTMATIYSKELLSKLNKSNGNFFLHVLHISDVMNGNLMIQTFGRIITGLLDRTTMDIHGNFSFMINGFQILDIFFMHGIVQFIVQSSKSVNLTKFHIYFFLTRYHFFRSRFCA